MLKRLLLLCSMFGVIGTLVADETGSVEIVHGRGRNADYRLAVYEALVQAMSQVQGLSLQDSRDTTMDSFRKSVTASAGNVSIDEMRQTLKQSVSANTHGRILSYELTTEEFDKELGLWCIEVDAKVPGQYIVGRDPNNLRRLVVMPFRATGNVAHMMGSELDPSSGCEAIADRLNEDLTQTRRFTMLERSFNGETMAELARLDYENASAMDFGRFRQLLVTDYMVIGTIRLFDQPPVIENKYTGTARMSDGPFMEVSYRVILVPTSQLKWANTITIPYSAAAGSSPAAIVAAATAAASAQITAEIIENIYPIRITAKTTYELVLNQGGKNIHVGDVYEVYRESEDIEDVTTGESLGGAEEMIARMRITRVAPKMSYATVIEGTPPEDIDVGSIVRKCKVPILPYGASEPNPAPKSVVHPNGGVRAPWKKF